MSLSTTRLLRFYLMFGRLYTSMFTTLLERYRMTQTEVDVLLFLANNPPLDTAKDIVLYRGIVKSQVSTAVEALVRKGYLTRAADPQDRRLVHLAASDTAEPIVRQAKQAQSRFARVLLDGLGEEQLEQLQAILHTVTQNMRNAAGKEDESTL